MKVAIHHNPRIREQRAWMVALQEGFNRHGIEAELHDHVQPVPCDLAVFWSHKKDPIIQNQKAQGRDYLVIERGYLGARMTDWCSLGFNGLNGRAEFHNENVPDDRGQQWHHLLKPLHFGDYTVIMGQVPGDKAIEGINIAAWAEDCAKKAPSVVAKLVRYRPHPVGKAQTRIPETTGTLTEDLERAHWCITYNSNAGVDAVLAGVPVVALDRGSMAWDVAAHDFRYQPASDDARIQWLNKLAYCQWTITEIRNGTAWDHLAARYQ